jgi:hypothetical protein
MVAARKSFVALADELTDIFSRKSATCLKKKTEIKITAIKILKMWRGSYNIHAANFTFVIFS